MGEYRDVVNSPYFEIVDEAPCYISVNKPANLLTHPSKPGQPYTLWDGLRDLLFFETACGGQISIINRLDRETSGMLLVAKSAQAARFFNGAMQRREIQKEYYALVVGWPAQDEFTVDEPLRPRVEVGPAEVNLQQMVHEGGSASCTDFSVEKRFLRPGTAVGEKFSLVRCRLHTGRMHQIRVHLAHVGHPVVGDKLYLQGDGKLYLEHIHTGWSPELAEKLLLPRHALHSCLLQTPWLQGQTLRWEAPLPGDFLEFMAGEI